MSLILLRYTLIRSLTHHSLSLSLSVVVNRVACDSCATLLAASATRMSKLSKRVAAAANAKDYWAE